MLPNGRGTKNAEVMFASESASEFERNGKNPKQGSGIKIKVLTRMMRLSLCLRLSQILPVFILPRC